MQQGQFDSKDRPSSHPTLHALKSDPRQTETSMATSSPRRVVRRDAGRTDTCDEVANHLWPVGRGDPLGRGRRVQRGGSGFGRHG
jgi:hypothetical protein